MLPDQLKKFIEYRDHVNKIGNDMPNVFSELSRNIHSTNNFRFLLAIIMATELIKIKLRGLIILDDYIIEMRWFLESSGKYEIRKMNEYASRTYGQTLNEFFSRYNIEDNNRTLQARLQDLNKVRNEALHNGIMKYGGNIHKIDDEVKPYVLTQAINNLQHDLTTLFNTRRMVLVDIEHEMKEKGLY